MSLENNLYLRSMTFEQTNNMFSNSYHSQDGYVPDLEEGEFDKRYTEQGKQKRFWTAIPLAAFDVTIRSIYRLGLAIPSYFAGNRVFSCQLINICRNFQLAAGRLYGMWNDKGGMKIVQRALLEKHCLDMYGGILKGFQIEYNDGNHDHDLITHQFFYQCAINKLHDLGNSNYKSLEDALTYLHKSCERDGSFNQKQELIDKFISTFFQDHIFSTYENEYNLEQTYMSLLSIIHETYLGTNRRYFCENEFKQFENKFYITIKKLREKIITYHTTHVYKDDGTKSKQKLLEICNSFLENKKKVDFAEEYKAIYLAHEYLQQGMEKEAIDIHIKRPATLFYRESDEILVKVLQKHPEHFSLFHEKKDFYLGQIIHHSNYEVGAIAENKTFLYGLLITNPNLLEIDFQDCKNQVLNDIITKQKIEIESIIDEIKKPINKENGKIQNLEGINKLDPENPSLLNDLLKNDWFIAEIAKINPEIIRYLEVEQREKAIKKLFSKEDIFNTLLTMKVVSKKLNIQIPKGVQNEILIRL